MYNNPRTGLRTYFITFGDGSRLELMNRPGLEPALFNPLQGGYVHLSFGVGSKEAVDNLTKDWLMQDMKLLTDHVQPATAIMKVPSGVLKIISSR